VYALLADIASLKSQGQNPHFITALVSRLKLEYYAEGDVVVAEGDLGTVMYFVVTGQLEGRHYPVQKVTLHWIWRHTWHLLSPLYRDNDQSIGLIPMNCC
jgi:hypothetical protein